MILALIVVSHPYLCYIRRYRLENQSENYKVKKTYHITKRTTFSCRNYTHSLIKFKKYQYIFHYRTYSQMIRVHQQLDIYRFDHENIHEGLWIVIIFLGLIRTARFDLATVGDLFLHLILNKILLLLDDIEAESFSIRFIEGMSDVNCLFIISRY